MAATRASRDRALSLYCRCKGEGSAGNPASGFPNSLKLLGCGDSTRAWANETFAVAGRLDHRPMPPSTTARILASPRVRSDHHGSETRRLVVRPRLWRALCGKRKHERARPLFLIIERKQ